MKIYWMNLFGIAAFAIVMAFIFLSGFSHRDPIAVPVALGFLTIGMLATATGGAVRAIVNRLEQIASGSMQGELKIQEQADRGDDDRLTN